MKDIKGYEGLYAITRDGRIWSYPKPCSSINGIWLKQSKITTKRIIKKDYQAWTVLLYKDNKAKRFLSHRLVGLTYIPNPDNLPQINHKDGNPLNNRVSNLEWATQIQNMQHAQENGLIPQHTEKQMETRSQNGKKTGPMNSMKSRRMFTMAEADCIRKYTG